MLRVSALDQLFSDPYSLYASTILGLRPHSAIWSRNRAIFGTLAHRAIRALCEYWNAQQSPPDAATLGEIVDAALADFANRPSVQLFWRQRLLKALQFVNAQEEVRRNPVASEVPIEETVILPNSQLVLVGHGPGENAQGLPIVADYKTGTPPTLKEMNDGRAVQLMAYAMLLAEQVWKKSCR